MKHDLRKLLAASVLGGALLTACETRHPVVVTPTGRIVVPEAPPPPRQEVEGTPAAPADIWVPGYWTYTNNRWVWIPASWQNPPRVGATWIAGHWEHASTGWVWTPGHWE